MSGEKDCASLPDQGLRVFLAGDEPCVGVRVSPSAPRTALRGIYGERLKVSVNALPEDNRANRQLVESLAGWLGVSREKVRVLSGHGSRDKVVAFAGMSEAELRCGLIALLRRGEAVGEERLGGSQGP